MKKKVLAAIIMVMAIGCICACGSKKEENASSTAGTTVNDAAAVSTDEVFSNDDYSISYSKNAFEVNEVRGSVVVSYCRTDLQYSGSNEIIITKDEGTSVDDIINAIAGDSKDMIYDGSVGEDAIPAKIYTSTSESPADSSLTLVDSFISMQSGDDVITLEIIRTVGQADEVDMTIEGDFTHTLESFKLNK